MGRCGLVETSSAVIHQNQPYTLFSLCFDSRRLYIWTRNWVCNTVSFAFILSHCELTDSTPLAPSFRHNFGCQHDRGTANKCFSTDTSYGYRDPQARFRTVLAYNCASGQCDGNSGGGCTVSSSTVRVMADHGSFIVSHSQTLPDISRMITFRESHVSAIPT